MKTTLLHIAAVSALLASTSTAHASFTTYASTLTITTQTLEGLDREDPTLMFVDSWLTIGDQFTVDDSRPLTGPFDLGLSTPFIFGIYNDAVSNVTLTPSASNTGLFSLSGPRSYGHDGRAHLFPGGLSTQTWLGFSPFGSVTIGGLEFGVSGPSFDPALLGQSLNSAVGPLTNYAFHATGILGLDDGASFLYIGLDASPLRIVPAPIAAALFALAGALATRRRRR